MGGYSGMTFGSSHDAIVDLVCRPSDIRLMLPGARSLERWGLLRVIQQPGHEPHRWFLSNVNVDSAHDPPSLIRRAISSPATDAISRKGRVLLARRAYVSATQAASRP